jgi:hypothetical protein
MKGAMFNTGASVPKDFAPERLSSQTMAAGW